MKKSTFVENNNKGHFAGIGQSTEGAFALPIQPSRVRFLSQLVNNLN